MKISNFAKKTASAVAAFVVLGSCASAASASIIGDTVNVRFTDFVNFDVNSTVVVGNGVDGSFFFGNYQFDIEDSYVRFIVNGNFCGHTCSATDASVIFSGLNFGKPIQGLTLTNGGLNPYGATFTADSITMKIPDSTMVSGNFAKAEVVLAKVPEPTSIALLGLGLAGFAAVRRKSVK